MQQIRGDLQESGRAKVGYCQVSPWPIGCFDGVVPSEVLEHLSDQGLGRAPSEVNRVLKAGGLFCGTVPARDRLHENVMVCPYCNSKFYRWRHQQSFDCARMRKSAGTGLRSGQFVGA